MYDNSRHDEENAMEVDTSEIKQEPIESNEFSVSNRRPFVELGSLDSDRSPYTSINEAEAVFKYSSQILSSNGEKFYLNDKMSDFHFVFQRSGNNKQLRIPAHKIFLSASDVFETTFDKNEDELEIRSTNINAFKEFLQFFYSSRGILTKGNIAEVMELGKKYHVPDCINACAELMMTIVTNQNVCWAYEHAINNHHEKLIKYCEAIIGTKTMAVLESKTFQKCTFQVLSRIVKMDSLHCSEAELFKACLAWAKSKAGQPHLTADIVKQELGKLLYDIRFGQIAMKELTDIVSTIKDIFSADEYFEIIRMSASEEYKPEKFKGNTRKRSQPFKFNENEIHCDRLICPAEPYYIKEVETILISTNKPIVLSELTFESLEVCTRNGYNPLDENLETKMTIVEIHNGERVMVYNETFELNNEEATDITLPKPILMRAGSIYEIQMKQTPPEKCCTRFLFRREVKLDSGAIIRFEKDDEKSHEKSAFVTRGLLADIIVNPLAWKREVFIVNNERFVIERMWKLILLSANAAIEENGVFRIGLSGGPLINYLASGAESANTDWSKWQLYLCDERFVDESNDDSTFGQYKQLFIPKTKLTESQFVTINRSVSLNESAKIYEQQIYDKFGIEKVRKIFIYFRKFMGASPKI